jgi:hypothetical protein
MSVEKPLSSADLKSAEEAAMMVLQNYLNAFIALPTQRNRALVIERMDQYQDSWMNGRRRPA